MNQPELGIQVLENRKRKDLTQEQLAELCEVSTRTIQRIESGEVEPRAFTRAHLSRVLEFDFGEQNEENETLWLTILHLSSCFCILLVPLLIWSWKKGSSAKIAQQGRIVLNFQITMTLVLFSAAFLLLVIPPLLFMTLRSTESPNIFLNVMLMSITVLPIITAGLFCFVQGIRNTLRLIADKPAHYPLSIQFIK